VCQSCLHSVSLTSSSRIYRQNFPVNFHTWRSSAKAPMAECTRYVCFSHFFHSIQFSSSSFTISRWSMCRWTRTYDKTLATDNLTENWKHLSFLFTDHGALWLFYSASALEILLLTYFSWYGNVMWSRFLPTVRSALGQLLLLQHVCVAVCVSVTLMCCAQTSQSVISLHRIVAQLFWFFHTEYQTGSSRGSPSLRLASGRAVC